MHATPELTELAQGEWEGRLLSDVRANWPEKLAAWRRRPDQFNAPGGEPLSAAADRVAAGLNTIMAALTPATASQIFERDPVPGYQSASAAEAAQDPWAVLVAHDGIFRLALLTLLGMPLGRFWSLPFNLCGLTVVGLHDGVVTLRAHNISDHLAPLAAEARAAEEARGDRRGAL